MMIPYVKSECKKYSIPDENCEPIIALSTNENELWIAVTNTRMNILLYKLENGELSFCETFYTGNRNKIIGLEWSKQDALLVIAIDMSCIIYKKDEHNKWKHSNVHIPSKEELPTCVCWHPYAYAFAIGFSSGLIFICSKKEKQKWNIKKITNHMGMILFMQWSSSGYFLSTNSLDTTSLLLYMISLCEINENPRYTSKKYEQIEKILAKQNFKNNEIIHKIECKESIILHTAFSLENARIAIIVSNFKDTNEKQQIIISDFLKSPVDTQMVTWIGQTMQKCLFIEENKLIVCGNELYPIMITCVNEEWILSMIVLPEYTIKNLSVEFFYNKKAIKDIEEEQKHLDGNHIVSELIAHSNRILQLSMLEPYQLNKPIRFLTVSSDFNIIIWTITS